jgi:uncharacterized protein YoxC
MNTSLLWQIPLALALLALAWLFVSLAYSIGRALKSIENLVDKEVSNLLKSTENLVGVHKEVSTLLESLDQTVTELNRELPQLLENVNGITASIQQISESEIQPTTHSIQEMTETINRNVAKIDELINVLTDFSQTTVKRAKYYRDQLSVPVTDIISGWSGIKAGWEVFHQFRKSRTSDSEDTTQQEQSE